MRRADALLRESLEKHSIPEPNSGCILWIGGINPEGYGRIDAGDRLEPAHRLAYELANGPVPRDLVMDHLCRVHCCINPRHLEPVTNFENIRRGGVRFKPETCPKGHPLSGENLYQTPRGTKECRRCRSIRGTVVDVGGEIKAHIAEHKYGEMEEA